MKQYKCIIIEDEPLAMERMESFVAKVPFLNLLKTFDNGLDALLYLKHNDVDILFLDINLGDLSGIQIAENFKNKIEIIFTTAYPEYALKGFELNVTDYLLKPFTFDRFYQSVERVLQKFDIQNNQFKVPKFLFIKTEYRLEKIDIDDILYIEGMGDYRRIHTISKKIMTLQTFKELEKELINTSLIRIHKSFVVNVYHIESIERDRVNICNQLLPISQTYRKSLYEKLSDKS